MKMKLLMVKECATIILAAGNSSRMGRPKFALLMPNGATFLENIIDQYSDFGCREIVVVLNHEGIDLIKERPLNNPSQIKIVLNPHPKFGRFYSIKTGIEQVESGYTFIQNIDNPYAKKEILEHLYNSKKEADVVKPVYNGKGGHPVLISKQIMDYILQEKKLDINLKEVLNNFSTKKVKVKDDTVLLNINTHPDYNNFIDT